MGPLVSEIDPRKLLTLATIIDTGSFKSAAKVLQVTQPALSSSMARFEAELGMRLLKRSSRGVAPTSIGSVLYGHARLIRDEIGQIRNALFEQKGHGEQPIRIGILPSLASRIVPAALNKWREDHPGSSVQMAERAQIDLLSGLLRREFDLVFGFTECFDFEEGLRQRVLFRDQLCIIASPHHPLGSMEELSWEILSRYPWVSPTSKGPHVILEAALNAAMLPFPKQITVCGTVTLLKATVAESEHLALLPAHAISRELTEQKLIRLPMRDQILNRSIAVYFREGFSLSDAARDLIARVQTVGQEICVSSEAGAGSRVWIN